MYASASGYGAGRSGYYYPPRRLANTVDNHNFHVVAYRAWINAIARRKWDQTRQLGRITQEDKRRWGNLSI